MARPRRQPAAAKSNETKKLKPEDLHYLAGVWETSQGLKSPASLNAVAISNKPEWPQYLAKTFGGEARQFTSNAGKNYWGWFVGAEQKLAILDLLEGASVIRGYQALDRDSVRAKLLKAAGKGA